MKPDVRDKLRKHAERLTDEATRLQRELSRSAPSMPLATQHLANVEKAAAELWRDGFETVTLNQVVVMTEYAVAPPVETRGRKKEQRQRVKA